ncbi:MAG: helix-hairpin-helix domain-containing protein [Mangrovimonas sp.]|nr:helix-hairpin-helix domain-containing protein [Mangrovimonas sp.]MCB0438392.1 helix-hairpin-helix domain-containing protein [Mangrovimonas sp.]
MNSIKSHFQFTKKQRSGIFLLLMLIVFLQGVWFYLDSEETYPKPMSNEVLALRMEVDSLRKVQIQASKPKIYPFNPNFITDYKGYTLGMTQEEINRLLVFRAKDQWVNSIQQFQEVTGISDSLLEIISPYFKFPEWVTNSKPSTSSKSYDNFKPKTISEKTDLNKATAQQLQSVYGIGEKLSERIIKYRNKFEGGFIDDVQLTDIYGLTPEVVERILEKFAVKTPRSITKIPLNSATQDQLVTVQYIDYEVANNIIEARTLREGFKSLEELTKVKDFPIHKIEIIKLYLTLD